MKSFLFSFSHGILHKSLTVKYFLQNLNLPLRFLYIMFIQFL